MALTHAMAEWILNARSGTGDKDIERIICASNVSICAAGSVSIVSYWWSVLRPHAENEPARGFATVEAYAASLGYGAGVTVQPPATALEIAQAACAAQGKVYNQATQQCVGTGTSTTDTGQGEIAWLTQLIKDHPLVVMGVGGVTLLFLLGRLKSG